MAPTIEVEHPRMGEDPKDSFTTIQAMLIRERLILLFTRLKKPFSVRDLLVKIIQSESTSYDFDALDLLDDTGWDDTQWPLKLSALTKFLSRRDNSMRYDNLLEIACFVIEHGLLSWREIEKTEKQLSETMPLGSEPNSV